ncbi:flagellar biosynthetic protein FliR [uncultured Pseudokineococcus sp.]|uniref:flagellar biosynthetic protein FliR n=1 Tax=uncultured Pseudokineococcus sp. TaxID=1642928 RepID=UPI0026017B9D|nr:flagellar biosynthetic protein FliR [uncultured Pseudokineococcus sp.]
MELSLPLDEVVATALASLRVLGWLLLAPPFAYKGFPGQVKALLALALALVVQPDVSALVATGLSAVALLVAATQELVIGTALGWLCYLVFAAVQSAGDLLDVFGGFQLAQGYDPLMQSGSSILGKVHQLLALALLFASGAHLVVLGGLLRTFDVLPVGQAIDLSTVARVATEGIGGLMLAALQIAGPLIAVLFLTDVGLGLLTRVAPQLNAFSLGFPLKILVTLVLVGLTATLLPDVVRTLADQMAETVMGTARASGRG